MLSPPFLIDFHSPACTATLKGSLEKELESLSNFSMFFEEKRQVFSFFQEVTLHVGM